LTVGPIGYGVAALGNLYRALPDDVWPGCVPAAWQAGVRYFDTAPHYGLGLSERRLGAALAVLRLFRNRDSRRTLPTTFLGHRPRSQQSPDIFVWFP
ncbi:MAG: aldo/keto reductase, partial [Candidatus Acidoferrum typicum]|nr:aldo/keto reductase [Candidatus Acidoferrum typicum]